MCRALRGQDLHDLDMQFSYEQVTTKGRVTVKKALMKRAVQPKEAERAASVEFRTREERVGIT